MIVTCPSCGEKMIWQTTIREFYCDLCDYLMDQEQVIEKGTYSDGEFTFF